jgi:hypothetical protein
MKRWFLIVLFAMIAVMSFGLSLGACADWQWLNQSLSVPGYKETYRFPNLGVGAFFDAKYVRLSGQYVFTFTDPKALVYYDGVKDDLDSAYLTEEMQGTVINYLAITLLVKVPVPVGKATIAPAVGATYMLNLALEQYGLDLKEGATLTDKNSLNDIVLLGGVILTSNTTKKIYVTFDAFFGYNTTPDFFPDMLVPNVSFFSWMIKAGISVGFRLTSP